MFWNAGLTTKAHSRQREHNEKGVPMMEFMFGLGTKSGLPRYVALIGLLQTVILFVPEATWSSMGIDASQHLHSLPEFVQNYIQNSSFKNAMFIFWLASPLTLAINSILFIRHFNFLAYTDYQKRRASRLKKSGRTNDYTLIFGALTVIATYTWGVVIDLNEPISNRWGMITIQAGSISLLLPASITILVTELRANLFE